MGQYPQGIFESLDWLLKKVRMLLALQKQPSYTFTSTITTVYNMPGRGMYNGIDSTGAGRLQFPNPALLQGQTIILNFSNATDISATYAPLVNGLPMITTAISQAYIIISNGTNWIVVGTA